MHSPPLSHFKDFRISCAVAGETKTLVILGWCKNTASWVALWPCVIIDCVNFWVLSWLLSGLVGCKRPVVEIRCRCLYFVGGAVFLPSVKVLSVQFLFSEVSSKQTTRKLTWFVGWLHFQRKFVLYNKLWYTVLFKVTLIQGWPHF